nr:MAG TPA: hypothetical protein [Caudoviricetes sp.]
MEVVYRALTGTKLEKIFTSEEECKRYEYLNSIKMWDWAGDRTDDFAEAMVLLLPLRGEQLLRERWGDEIFFDSESPFRGLIDEDGYPVCTPGFYFYDTDHHQFFFGGKTFLNAIRNFIDKNPKEINKMLSF